MKHIIQIGRSKEVNISSKPPKFDESMSFLRTETNKRQTTCSYSVPKNQQSKPTLKDTRKPNVSNVGDSISLSIAHIYHAGWDAECPIASSAFKHATSLLLHSLIQPLAHF